MISEAAAPRFPYMAWARNEAARTRHPLSASGMPAPDPALLGPLPGLDLGHPGAEALPDFEAAVAEVHGVVPARAIATLGASGAMFLAALRWFRRGAVVTEVPSYEPFRALPALLGAPHRVLARDPEHGLDLDAVERALADLPRPAHLFLCNPHNPSGHLLSAEHLVGLAELAARAGGILISNETYMEYAPLGERFHAATLAPNAISLGSLTKAYGLGPLRAGWIVLGEGLAHERAELVDLTCLVHVDAPTSALRAARAALERREALLAPLRDLERTSRPLLERWLASTPGVTGRLGPYGLTAFPRIEGARDTRALAERLVAEADVDTVPGEFFGAPGHLRVSFGLPAPRLAAALERLTAGLATQPGRT